MHLNDALLSLPVAGGCGALALGSLALAARRASAEASSGGGPGPRLGVLAAFVFAGQALNVPLPGTGLSGHLLGGSLLAILLGPWAGFLAMATLLAAQALLLGEGGLLALGANLLNMGFAPCFAAVPLVYAPLARSGRPGRQRWAALASSLAASLLGALGLCLELALSGRSGLGFAGLAAVLLPLHAAVGLLDGLLSLAALEALGRFRLRQSPWAGAGRGPAALGALGLAALLGAAWLLGRSAPAPEALEGALASLGAAR